MPEQEIIAGLDIGSTAIRLAVGQRLGQEEKIHIIGSAEVPAEGISKGIVSSIEDAVSAITGCLEKAERMAGRPIESAWVGISGSHIISQESRGVVAVARSDGEISEDDIERAIEAAQAVATPPNAEILHVIPRTFTVDGQEGIKDPIGMTGVRLETETHIITGSTTSMRNLVKCVSQVGIDVTELVFSGIASALAVLSDTEKELGVVLVDIGGETTDVVIFIDGSTAYSSVIPIGARHITSDMAVGLRVSLESAEKIKLSFAGDRPNLYQKAYAKDGGEVDALIRDIAYNESAVLVTADKVQSESAKALGIEVQYYHRQEMKDKLGIEEFFDSETMSIHIKEDCLVKAKKGKPGEWRLDDVSPKVLSQLDVQFLTKEIVERSRIEPNAFIEISREGSTIVQYKDYRIVIAKPPVSDGWEITAVKPIKVLKIEDYNLPEKISEKERAMFFSKTISSIFDS